MRVTPFDFEPKILALIKVSDSNPPCITPVIKHPPGTISGQACKTDENPSCDPDLQPKGGSNKATARSRLYEICAANCWKAPLFECCREEGPSHLKLFTFKVIVEIEAQMLFWSAWEHSSQKRKMQQSMQQKELQTRRYNFLYIYIYTYTYKN
ncbi:uncharacterized protein LOC109002495 isoform X2 [Juglans regia]|uniref:Uncharacterized protein LOC109002495 isoform X2 n=1 Tax=Juglans regia TaxID=51240 RepID=A0A6P9ESJ6_JUGRE|nr:uncharacterized protein LOC109002495 isoform X2 [Juglans regia]